jgi:O-antigen ligase
LNLPAKLNSKELLFFFFSAIAFIAGNIILLINDIPLLPLLPLVIVYLLIVINNYSLVYYFTLAVLPFSFDQSLFGGFSLSIPAEPLMITLLFLSGLMFFRNKIDIAFFRHPLFALLILHLALFIFNIFISIDPVVSVKYFLAKLWFIAAFVIVPSFVIQSEKELKKSFWYFFIPLMITVCYTMARYAMKGFAFDEVNSGSRPFYVNHVVFSCTLGISLPFIWYARQWYRNNLFLNWLIIGSIALILIAIGFAYTRTTWIAVAITPLALIVFTTKYFKKLMVIGLLAVAGFCYHLLDNNRYMKYAPDYEHTVFNKEDLGKHLEATYELQDVSGMERVYRWVAALGMIKDNFWLGTGTNTFYPEYKKYANPSFITWVSNNSERSTAHNYFLLLMCEQGVFGFILFTTLYLAMIIYCYNIYHRSKSKLIRRLSIACYLSLIILLVHLILGDMIEIDKSGGIFFLILALIIKLDIWSRVQITDDRRP